MESNTQEIEKVQAIVDDFADIIGYAVTSHVSWDESSHMHMVEIEGENLGGLIGFHGKNISSIEHILNLMAARHLEKSSKWIYLDINGYRKVRLEGIKKYVENTIKKVEKTHTNYSLYPMTSFERLFVHNLLKNYDFVTGESEGEEPNRFITIKVGG